MKRTVIKGVGSFLPENVVTNADLEKLMDTNDEWIQERTGIKERRWVNDPNETTSTMAVKASKKAMAVAGVEPDDIDFVIFATLSPDYYFPGNGVLVQRDLGLKTVGAMDVRNQCSGFIYGLSVADQFIKSGMYKNILLIGSELHSGALEKTTNGRAVSVIFGDGAGAVILSAAEDGERGILSTCMHSEGAFAEELMIHGPSTTHWVDEILAADDPNEASWRPHMNGNFVFKHAITRMPEAINEVLAKAGKNPEDIDLLIPHQANLRISSMVQRHFKMDDSKVFNNIQTVGNTTAGSIPIAMTQAIEEGKLKRGDLLCLAAFGSGFTWGAALLEF
ncbi:MAG TPA: beta-ketoacyl-ACP synthase III [Cryomorphaceae bacterium]|nr:beta-ketoacyl-ACP synthase III [Cryomorphaceae bacterium]